MPPLTAEHVEWLCPFLAADEDNLQTVHVAPQVCARANDQMQQLTKEHARRTCLAAGQCHLLSLWPPYPLLSSRPCTHQGSRSTCFSLYAQVPLVKDLPPSLRRFLSPRRSMRSSEFALAAEGQRSVEVARLSGISSVSDGGQSGHAAQNGGLMGRQGSGGSGALVGANGHATAAQAAVHGSPPRGQQRSGSRSSLATHSRSISHTSLGAAAAANVLMVAGGPGGADAEAVAAGVTAGIRAAELQHGGGGPAMRPPLPRSSLAGRSRSAELVRGGGSGRGTPDLGPGSYLGGRPLTPDAYTSTSPRAPADRAAAPGDPAAVRGGSSGGEHVTVELGEVSLATTEDGSEDASAARPLVKPGKFGS